MHIHNIFKFVTKNLITFHKKNYILLLLFMIFSNLIQVSSFLSIIPFVTYLLDPTSQNLLVKFIIDTNFFDQNSIVLVLGIFSIIFLLIGSFISIIAIYYEKKFGYKLLTDTKFTIYDFFLGKNYKFFLNTDSGFVSSIILSDVERYGTNIVFPFLRAISSLIILLIFFIFLIFFYPIVTIFLIIFFPSIYYLIFILVKGKLIINSKIISKTYEASIKIIVDTVPLIKEIKIYNKEETYKKNLFNEVNTLNNTHASNQIIAEIPKYFIEATGFVFIILTCLIFEKYYENFYLLVPSIAFFSIVGYKSLPSIQIIFNSMTSIRGNSTAVESLVINAPFLFDIKTNDRKVSNKQQNKKSKFEKSILFKNISFRYESADKEILKSFNIKINKNKFIGIKGPSGSGKSTLINIITGLLEADKGEVTIDEDHYSAKQYFELQPLKRLIGYVPQNAYLINDTIINNIAFGSERPDINQIKNLVNFLGMDSFIQKLPEKGNTVVGENGVKLSGGQKQRVAIARALYTKPEILIFDESTSSLDDFNSEIILNVVSKLKIDKTVIFISHSSNIINHCDEYYDFELEKLITKN